MSGWKLEKRNSRGFSLIELMVTIFILVLAIGITLVSMSDTKPMDEVEAASRGIAALIREAQNSSLTGREQLDGGVLKNVCDNGVQFLNGTNLLTVTNNFKNIANCGATGSLSVEKTSTFKNVQVALAENPDNVTDAARIQFITPSGKVEFSNGNTILPSSTVSVKITITSTTKSSIKGTVCVYSSGNVKEIAGDLTGNCP